MGEKYLQENRYPSASTFGFRGGEYCAGRIKTLTLTKSVSGKSATTDESEGKYTVFQGFFPAGLTYFSKNWPAIELSTNLVTLTHSDNIIADSNSNSFDFGLNASAINLGVSFFLNNK